jgi:hypothetical protein
MSKNRDDDYVATKVEKSFDDDGNTVVAELDKKTTLSSVLDGSGKKSTGLIRPEKGKPFKIKEILLGKKNVVPFKKK